MTPDQKIAMASRRYNNAALALAASVDVADRLANDPDFPADRSAWADARRAEMRVEDLRRYREAESALLAAHREGDCEHCSVPLAKCRDDRGRCCCEDCTHPRPADPVRCPKCGGPHPFHDPVCVVHPDLTQDHNEQEQR